MSTYSVQLDLFEERTRRLSSGRRALNAFDLPAARREFQALLERSPKDSEARMGLEVTERLLSRLSSLKMQHGDIVRALLMMENEIAEDYKKGWHRCLAREAERAGGDGCWLPGGMPAGLHWRLGGELDEAERSLHATMRKLPGDARARAFLGDILYLKGDLAGARSEYLLAFLVDPAAVVLGRLADPGVAALAEVSRSLYGVPGDVMDWIPAVGTVEGAFTLPPPVIPGLLDPLPAGLGRDTPGLLFYRRILKERSAQTHQERVGARRHMKALCPKLLAAYLENFYV